MTLFINFITGVAWICGGLCAVAVSVLLLPPISRSNASDAGGYILAGVLPWAWLLARYVI